MLTILSKGETCGSVLYNHINVDLAFHSAILMHINPYAHHGFSQSNIYKMQFDFMTSGY